jgi:hypothetical protein
MFLNRQFLSIQALLPTPPQTNCRAAAPLTRRDERSFIRSNASDTGDQEAAYPESVRAHLACPDVLADADPYCRIFNPVAQGEKFDPDAACIRRWVPELERLPAPWIHKPW